MSRRRVALIAAFVGLAAAALSGHVLSEWNGGRAVSAAFVGAMGLAFLVVGYGFLENGGQARPSGAPAPVDVPPGQPDPSVPYRGRLRRRLVPRVSGVVLSLLVGACLVASTLVVPLLLKLPRWVEAELVLVGWWLFGVGLLSTVLFRGLRFHDDVRTADWPWRSSFVGGSGSDGDVVVPRVWSWFEAVLGDLGVFLLLALIIAGAAWLLIELLLPLVFAVLYVLTRGALAHVMNDAHGCAGSLGRSLTWGAFWATLYVAPLALLIWAVRLIAS